MEKINSSSFDTIYLRNHLIIYPACYHSLDRKEGRKKRNVLFNNILNTFYLQLHGVRHMVKDHSVR